MKKEKSFITKLIPAIIKGTLMTLVSIIVFLMLFNFSSLLFSHVDGFTQFGKINNALEVIHENSEGVMKTMSSKNVYYGYLVIILLMMEGTGIYFFYPKENVL